MPIELDRDTLQRAMRCPPDLAATYAPLLTDACAAYSIDTPARMAAFLAQIGHESGGLRHTTELWGPTPAQARYEGRADLGNTEPGDGARFKGHGLIQTTGRYNHRAVRDRLRARLGSGVPDFEAEPERLAEPRWAAWSAADYWGWRDLNPLADAGDFIAITRRINGGTNGQADRERRWEIARAALGATEDRPAPVHTIGVQPEPTPPKAPPQQEATMPLPAILSAVLPTLIGKIPELIKISNAKGDARKEQALQLAADVVVQATGAANLQAAVEAVQADPQAASAARTAVRERWADIAEMSEAGGGGIDGARKADAAAAGRGDMLWSPSFWVALALLPLVYMVLVSVLFGVGPEWPSDVRAAIATAIVSMIVGGVSGYYFGQTTSRNRGPVPPQ